MTCEPCEGDGIGIESDGLVAVVTERGCVHCGGSGRIDPSTDTSSARYRRERAARAFRRAGFIS